MCIRTIKTIFFVILLAWCGILKSSASWCGTSLPRQAMIDAFTSIVPMSDGSHFTTTHPASAQLIDVISANLHAMGISMACTADTCTVAPRNAAATENACARIFVAAIIGNFLNNDLDPGDALAHVRVDVNTGFLRREYADKHYRMLFVDFLLVLAVIMLAKRAVQDQNNTNNTNTNSQNSAANNNNTINKL